ncbi:unnamed protein product [Cuscuta europaea]|uniref:Uncharacterized protein n=1 Tax=Cuscuta europaea TaxID=41803 RepID=A0A9P1E0H5_CUSEU|nr:unnamed protein product [Cuscuta europaea]
MAGCAWRRRDVRGCGWAAAADLVLFFCMACRFEIFQLCLFACVLGLIERSMIIIWIRQKKKDEESKREGQRDRRGNGPGHFYGISKNGHIFVQVKLRSYTGAIFSSFNYLLD